MDHPDFEAEYDNRARVPEHPAIFEGWARDSAAWRRQRPPRVLAYGPGERQAIDLFGDGDGPVVMFVHGGYWQAMDRSLFSHMARGVNLRGGVVAVAGYDLCPHVTLDDIVQQTRAACRAVWRETRRPLVVSGHSAGGHLAACMLATDWSSDHEAGADIVPAAYAVSGVFDLEPLRHTRLNAALGLSAVEAQRLSPLRWPAPAGKALDAVVGELESAEFHRQSREMAKAWADGGAVARYQSLPGADHFTAIAPLADPDSAMVTRLLELATAA